jgi:hypothetical protein
VVWKKVAISDIYAISVRAPDNYANSVPGAKQELVVKKHAISVIYAISVNAPGDYAISVIWAKQGKRTNVAQFHWPQLRPTYFANNAYFAISVSLQTQPI